MEFLPILVVLLFLVVIAAAMYGAHIAQVKRREALVALASELGWWFDPSRDYLHDDEYAHFEVFRIGHSRCAYNTLIGRVTIAGRTYPAKMGDFMYKVTRGTGKDRRTRTYRFSYLIVHLPFRNVPDLLIRPENFFDKIAGVFGFADINFESAEFSRQFHVKSPDKRFAYDVCHPRMMEFLLQSSPPAVDIERDRCCLCDGRYCWEPHKFKAMVQWIEQFFELWPEHVKAEFQSRRGWSFS